jgi:hypothetical protein
MDVVAGAAVGEFIEDLLVARLKARLSSDVLLADPIVYTIDEAALARYERRVLVH